MAKRRILIVDGDITAAGQLEQRLNRIGYEVSAIATSGKEATAMVAQAPPDLLLIAMELRDALKAVGAGDRPQTRRTIPVVYIACDEEESSPGLPDVGEPHGRVVKPFTDRELRATIDLALCQHDSARAAHELDGFFATSIDLLCLLDFNGRFKRLNPAWERTLGFTLQELMGRPFFEFVHPDDRERTLKKNRDVRSGGQALSFENRYLCKDGSYKWLRWNAAPDSRDNVIYSVARDVTASKLAEDERERLVRELQSALAEVRTLREILPICSYCRKVRDDENYWQTVESYISENTMTRFSHSICPSCMETEVEPNFGKLELK